MGEGDASAHLGTSSTELTVSANDTVSRTAMGGGYRTTTLSGSSRVTCPSDCCRADVTPGLDAGGATVPGGTEVKLKPTLDDARTAGGMPAVGS